MSQHQRKVKSTLDWLDALTNVFLCGPFDNNQVSRVRVSPNSWINTNRPQFNPLEVLATVLTICYFQIVPFIMTRRQSFKVHSKIWFLNFKFLGFYLKWPFHYMSRYQINHHKGLLKSQPLLFRWNIMHSRGQ